jgi:hypothetical protein
LLGATQVIVSVFETYLVESIFPHDLNHPDCHSVADHSPKSVGVGLTKVGRFVVVDAQIGVFKDFLTLTKTPAFTVL